MTAPRSAWVAVDKRRVESLTEARRIAALRRVLADTNHPLHLQLLGLAEVAVGMDRVGPPDGTGEAS